MLAMRDTTGSDPSGRALREQGEAGQRDSERGHQHDEAMLLTGDQRRDAEPEREPEQHVPVEAQDHPCQRHRRQAPSEQPRCRAGPQRTRARAKAATM